MLDRGEPIGHGQCVHMLARHDMDTARTTLLVYLMNYDSCEIFFTRFPIPWHSRDRGLEPQSKLFDSSICSFFLYGLYSPSLLCFRVDSLDLKNQQNDSSRARTAKPMLDLWKIILWTLKRGLCARVLSNQIMIEQTQLAFLNIYRSNSQSLHRKST